MNALIIIGALLLDQKLGETNKFHPLVGFGHVCIWLESKINLLPTKKISILTGLICLIIATLPLVLAVMVIETILGDFSWIFSVFILYMTLGLKSLEQHTQPLQTELNNNNLPEARNLLSRIVSRDTDKLDHQQVTSATIETTLENGCDAVFGALFWFMIGGAPLAVLYRLINTLDAMWGYRNSRYENFGKAAAKLDDMANYLPARLTALSYAMLGNFKMAMISWKTFAPLMESPNAGPVMSAGAGSLNIKLGGPTSYHGSIKDKPYFGGTLQAEPNDINRANTLLIKTAVLWCICIVLIEIAVYLIR